MMKNPSQPSTPHSHGSCPSTRTAVPVKSTHPVWKSPSSRAPFSPPTTIASDQTLTGWTSCVIVTLVGFILIVTLFANRKTRRDDVTIAPMHLAGPVAEFIIPGELRDKRFVGAFRAHDGTPHFAFCGTDDVVRVYRLQPLKKDTRSSQTLTLR